MKQRIAAHKQLDAYSEAHQYEEGLMFTRRKALGMIAVAPAALSSLPVFAIDRSSEVQVSLSAKENRCSINGVQSLERALAVREPVRVRFATVGGDVFTVRISGNAMKIVAADGFAVDPVAVDEFRIGGSETYDVVLTPSFMTAFALSAEVARSDVLQSRKALRYADLESVTVLPVVTPTREVVLTMSSAMRDHTWFYSGQSYKERGKAISVEEDEHVRITFHNDTELAHPIRFNELPFQIAVNHNRAARKQTLVLMPGEIISVDLSAANVATHTLTSERTLFAQSIAVRPCYQHHPLFAA